MGALMRGAMAAWASGARIASAVISAEIGPTVGCWAWTATAVSVSSSLSAFLHPAVAPSRQRSRLDSSAALYREFWVFRCIRLESPRKSFKLRQRCLVTDQAVCLCVLG